MQPSIGHRLAGIDEETARALGFPKPEYIAIERERRWLCRAVPTDLILQSEAIVDLYVTGTKLRLREARPANGTAPMLRLSRKADIDPHTRLVTSIYLSEEEFAILAQSLPGTRIRKRRHRLAGMPGIELLVDEFEGELAGLILAEAQFDTPERLAAFPMPDFALREVTDDPRYTGGCLVKDGVPPP